MWWGGTLDDRHRSERWAIYVFDETGWSWIIGGLLVGLFTWYFIPTRNALKWLIIFAFNKDPERFEFHFPSVLIGWVSLTAFLACSAGTCTGYQYG